MILLTIITLFLQFQTSTCQALDANGISLAEKVLAIERLMLTPGTIDFQVAPCSFVLNGPPIDSPANPGDQTAAQWVRTVFHDFITANVTAGTGGLDASVGFEADREENLGIVFGDESFINRTIIGFNLFSNVFISTADFIALGIAEAVLSCDPNSPMIKLRAGRIDATGPGPTGVPRPQDSLAIATAAFANAGFSKTEMIQAVACGHSLGAVHDRNFPEIVLDLPTVGTNGAVHFDSTPFVFDNTGVAEYLSGSGQAGGPLVNTANVTFRSDFRIFNSDNNATIKAMASSQKTFESTCFPIFEKMINTVPKGVVLSDVIGPRNWITMESHLDLTSTGAVTYSGIIGTFSKTAVPTKASYFYGTDGGGNTGPKLSNAGVTQDRVINHLNGATEFPFFGNVTFYTFNDTITSPSITSLNIQSSYTELINLNLFVVPSLSFVNPIPGTPKFLVRAALLTTLVKSGTSLTATLYYPSGQIGSTSPKYLQVQATLTTFGKKGNYTIFQGVITQPSGLPSNGGGASHIDVKLGTTQRSPKVRADAGFLLATCTNSDISTC